MSRFAFLVLLPLGVLFQVGCSGDSTPTVDDSRSSRSDRGSSSSSGGRSGDGSGGTDGTGTSGPSENANGPIYCAAEGNMCVCVKDPRWAGPNGSTTAACSKALVGGSAPCCASDSWPADGACTCLAKKVTCAQKNDGSLCTCGYAAAGANEREVSTCMGDFCCNSPSDSTGKTCSCYSRGVGTCPSGSVPVSSCSAGDLRCSGKEVSDCR